MSGADCTRWRELFTERLDGSLDSDRTAAFDQHLEACDACRELWTTTGEICSASALLGEIDPPGHLAEEIAGSPCRRWLGLLFAAVDREVGDDGLKRLLGHLEQCESCRRVWTDMTLVHQAGEALVPPPHLMEVCRTPWARRLRRPWVLGRRTATVAAYVLAVLSTLAIGNPVTLARYDASTAVEKMASTVGGEVAAAADTGRGELRVLMWRAIQWGERAAGTIQQTVERLRPGSPDDEEPDDTTEENRS